jgi:hypothetical protein
MAGTLRAQRHLGTLNSRLGPGPSTPGRAGQLAKATTYCSSAKRNQGHALSRAAWVWGRATAAWRQAGLVLLWSFSGSIECWREWRQGSAEQLGQ